MVIGMTLDEALKVTNRAVVEKLEGLPPQKLHCSVLAEEAIRLALRDYFDKNNIPYDPAEYPDPGCESCCHTH
jgi:nitrogen fixation NifU-like protein